ncbi:response regulator [Mucilaginibacter sp. L3T2-6]|uniref:sensor histidine kinase n=1 Tax=Mucilaginibacter sp. L3T2-6 TaxID=3062491 RepID=UPI0026772473|nr:response regulator [Mucilaginibacter sp. L3T2-6]MDO3642799.1 response regulator [Mucilaginibacter sp. L3T2-6]MDV6215448.1 response regulator [Mucilaginibacter sp. L3T2-6]
MFEITPKILIVDDKPENILVLSAVLADLDVELVTADSGNEALRATLNYDFALALLDIQMPEMDGYELAEILRQHKKTASLPIIFISAVYTDNLNIFKGYEKGAFSFITKPFQPEVLINKVKFFIEKHQQELALFRVNQDLQKSNAELKAVNRELESFSYSVSHDLKAPLRAINGFAQMLEEDHSADLNAEGKRLLSVIQENAKGMGVMINDLLEFSRLGRKDTVKTGVDMNELFNSALTEINSITTHNARIDIQPLPTANADRALLYRVAINLLSNAIKYSSKSDSPVVMIYSEQNDAYFIYVVADNGVGFNNEHAGKLFGIFQRLHSKAEFDGTGIGLALVKRIINKHGGEVWATGELNKGAKFYFSLPKQADLLLNEGKGDYCSVP